uniref:Chitinase A n=1 Tax=Burkholderia gladioli TaxID=28095 RepID=Q9LBM1_BURGA|nr:chitinase A [Burkholderia gladioli]
MAETTAPGGASLLKAQATPSVQAAANTAAAAALPSNFIFSAYKDITINLNWNTNVISTAVTGSLQPVLSVLPAKLKTLTWSFATGECGSESWSGLTGSQVAAANVQNMVNAGRNYIISTGGAAGSFSCGSDANFSKFINTYNSANLKGIDFDIEAGQSQAVINALVQRVKAAQPKYPNLRFSFTLATLGGNAAQSLGDTGVVVMNAIKAAGLQNYTINLMTMDYGSATPATARSTAAASATWASRRWRGQQPAQLLGRAVQPDRADPDDRRQRYAGRDLHPGRRRHGVELRAENGLAGVHFWSFDRDNDCTQSWASPTLQQLRPGRHAGLHEPLHLGAGAVSA